MSFDELNLMKPLLAAVKSCGYQEPTPIQRGTIPPVLAGRDVLGCAQTGTGKTAAFALPILQTLFLAGKPARAKRPIRALILTPTRELALQIYENFEGYGKQLPLRSCVIFGGVGQQPQVEQLQNGVDILVATPGRLNDLIAQGYIHLDELRIFVLDEADRMLDMGFIHDVRKVIARLPAKRQTLFFSATMPAEVEKLATSLLTDPVTVKVNPVSSTVDKIDQSLYMVDKANKRHLLAKLLSDPQVESALVFTRTKHGADRVVRELAREGIEARAIHGNKSQSARQQALADFKSGRVRVLIATDIAARGIDIAGLSHVFNYDLPNEPESYVHRIGRTGRAGRDGIAISFCCVDELKELKQIEKLTGKTLRRLESEWPMQVFTETVKEPRPARGARMVRPAAEDIPARARTAERAAPVMHVKEERRAAPSAKAAPVGNAAAAEAPTSSRKTRQDARTPERAPAMHVKEERRPAPSAKAAPAGNAAATEASASSRKTRQDARTPERAPVMRAHRLDASPRALTHAAHAEEPTPKHDRMDAPASREASPSYRELLHQHRKAARRRPLSTGNDRY